MAVLFLDDVITNASRYLPANFSGSRHSGSQAFLSILDVHRYFSLVAGLIEAFNDHSNIISYLYIYPIIIILWNIIDNIKLILEV